MLLTRWTFVAFVAILLVPAAGLFGAEAHFDDRVRADFFSGFAGNDEALDRAMASAEDSIASEPKMAAEAMAWHGAGLLLLSGRSFNQGDVARGAELWSNALLEMDEAGKREPDNPAVLIPRAAAWFATSRNAPPDMGQPLLEKALADYGHVYEMQKTYFDTLNIHMRSELLFGLADGWARHGDAVKARAYFEKLAALGPESGHKEQADLYLAGLQYSVKGIGCAGCHTAK
jgi:hypothetical protein